MQLNNTLFEYDHFSPQPLGRRQRPFIYTSPSPPPLSTSAQNERHGILGDVAIMAATAVAIMYALFRCLGRAQINVRFGENHLFAPLSGTSGKENVFTWIAPDTYNG
jgi:hypothetical protein